MTETSRGRYASPGAQFSLLASAIAGRSLEVAAQDPGQPAWSDSRTIYVDGSLSPHAQLRCVLVQACLVGAESLDPSFLARLGRKPATARRYLSLEGHRALLASLHLLPRFVFSEADLRTTNPTTSAQESLNMAIGTDDVPDPPEMFGVIRPQRVLPVETLEQRFETGPTHTPAHGRQRLLRELEDDVGDEPDIGWISSPVGGGGPIGRLLKRLLGDARSSGSGSPNPTRRRTTALAASHVSRGAGRSTAAFAVTHDGDPIWSARKFVYPEWDVHHRRYRTDWCTVIEEAPENGEPLVIGNTRALRRSLADLGTELELHRRQLQGEDVDIDGAIDRFVEVRAGSFPDEAVYIESRRTRRDLAVLTLVDISGSANEASASGGTVHDHQVKAGRDLTAALHTVGDRVALYGFRSQGRSAVRVFPVKRFDDGLAPLIEGRLGGLRPGGFTRLGAAIRHGVAILECEGGTSRRLLVILSDGFAYDHGYEGAYGEADARRALSEARRRGIGCLCISLAATTQADALRRVFGTAAHARFESGDQMTRSIGVLFQTALGTAEYQRIRSNRTTRANERKAIEGSSG